MIGTTTDFSKTPKEEIKLRMHFPEKVEKCRRAAHTVKLLSNCSDHRLDIYSMARK